MTSVMTAPPVRGQWTGAATGARGVIATKGSTTLAPWLTTSCTRFTSSSTSMKPPFIRLRCIQIGPTSMARSESQSLANCVIDSPSPPGQSPTVHAREADLGVLGAPRLDHPVERRLAHQVGGEARPRRREPRADRRQVRGGAVRRLEVRQRGGGRPPRHRSHWCRTRAARCRRRGPRSATAVRSRWRTRARRCRRVPRLPPRSRLDTTTRRSRRIGSRARPIRLPRPLRPGGRDGAPAARPRPPAAPVRSRCSAPIRWTHR